MSSSTYLRVGVEGGGIAGGTKQGKQVETG